MILKPNQLVTIMIGNKLSYSYILNIIKDKNDREHIIWISDDGFRPYIDYKKEFISNHIYASDDNNINIINDYDYNQFILLAY